MAWRNANGPMGAAANLRTRNAECGTRNSRALVVARRGGRRGRHTRRRCKPRVAGLSLQRGYTGGEFEGMLREAGVLATAHYRPIARIVAAWEPGPQTSDVRPQPRRLMSDV